MGSNPSVDRFVSRCYHNDIDGVKQLLDNEVEINGRSSVEPCRGLSALHAATDTRNIDLMKLLLDNGADVNVKTFPEKLTPLHYAAKADAPAVATFLLQHKALVDLQDTNGETALHFASGKGSIYVIRTLLAHNARTHLRNQKGYTPRDLALSTLGKDVVKPLFDSQGIGVKNIYEKSEMQLKQERDLFQIGSSAEAYQQLGDAYEQAKKVSASIGIDPSDPAVSDPPDPAVSEPRAPAVSDPLPGAGEKVICPACTFDNPRDSEKCEMCSALLIDEAEVPDEEVARLEQKSPLQQMDPLKHEKLARIEQKIRLEKTRLARMHRLEQKRLAQLKQKKTDKESAQLLQGEETSVSAHNENAPEYDIPDGIPSDPSKSMMGHTAGGHRIIENFLLPDGLYGPRLRGRASSMPSTSPRSVKSGGSDTVKEAISYNLDDQISPESTTNPTSQKVWYDRHQDEFHPKNIKNVWRSLNDVVTDVPRARKDFSSPIQLISDSTPVPAVQKQTTESDPDYKHEYEDVDLSFLDDFEAVVTGTLFDKMNTSPGLISATVHGVNLGVQNRSHKERAIRSPSAIEKFAGGPEPKDHAEFRVLVSEGGDGWEKYLLERYRSLERKLDFEARKRMAKMGGEQYAAQEGEMKSRVNAIMELTRSKKLLLSERIGRLVEKQSLVKNSLGRRALEAKDNLEESIAELLKIKKDQEIPRYNEFGGRRSGFDRELLAGTGDGQGGSGGQHGSGGHGGSGSEDYKDDRDSELPLGTRWIMSRRSFDQVIKLMYLHLLTRPLTACRRNGIHKVFTENTNLVWVINTEESRPPSGEDEMTFPAGTLLESQNCDCKNPRIWKKYSHKHFKEAQIANLTDEKYELTSLHFACRNGDTDLCKTLLENRANPNCNENFLEDTPLHYASFWGHAQIVQLLIEKKANPKQINNRRQRPLHYGKRRKNETVTAILLSLKLEYGEPPEAYPSDANRICDMALDNIPIVTFVGLPDDESDTIAAPPGDELDAPDGDELGVPGVLPVASPDGNELGVPGVLPVASPAEDDVDAPTGDEYKENITDSLPDPTGKGSPNTDIVPGDKSITIVPIDAPAAPAAPDAPVAPVADEQNGGGDALAVAGDKHKDDDDAPDDKHKASDVPGAGDECKGSDDPGDEHSGNGIPDDRHKGDDAESLSVIRRLKQALTRSKKPMKLTEEEKSELKNYLLEFDALHDTKAHLCADDFIKEKLCLRSLRELREISFRKLPYSCNIDERTCEMLYWALQSATTYQLEMRQQWDEWFSSEFKADFDILKKELKDNSVNELAIEESETKTETVVETRYTKDLLEADKSLKVAVSLYTYPKITVYSYLNDSMRCSKTIFCSLANHLLRGLQHLPTKETGGCFRIYRGCGYVKDRKRYKRGKFVAFQCFTSFSRNKDVAVHFAVNGGHLFILDAFTARSVQDFSHVPNEEECLLAPYTVLQVVKTQMTRRHIKKWRKVQEVNIYEIYLKEVPIWRGAKFVLWVDDNPPNNQDVVRAANRHGVCFVIKKSTSKALEFLTDKSNTFLLAQPLSKFRIVTDMTRMERWGNNFYAGADLIKALRDLKYYERILVFTSGTYLDAGHEHLKGNGLDKSTTLTANDKAAMAFACWEWDGQEPIPEHWSELIVVKKRNS